MKGLVVLMYNNVLEGKCKDIYELVKTQELADINSTGYLLRHKKSGARIAVISNDDNNKVFSIGFRTPPSDSTGVAHITEHAVLCGSRDYPLKDPFVELCKGSLNTFLNAMTYSDKTVYPVASCNDKDFANLMGVYMDAVFYPNIYNCKEIFCQEGWHYEMENEDSPLTINGVVYNEMRGVFSSPEQQLARLIQHSLFPDNTYGFESGGDPDNIPDLTYEDFIAFHKKYYHPSNSYIYLYGNVDIEDRLLWMDRYYLRFFDKIDVDSNVPVQEAFKEVRYMDDVYSAQNEDDKAYYSYNFVIDNSYNRELQVVFQVLTYALVLVPGAPIKKALTDAGIGEDISASYDNELLQPVFSIEACEAPLDKRDEFVKIIRDTLKDLCKNGIDKKSLLAAVSRCEFRYREADYGRYPKGLMFGLHAMQSWLYDDSMPFDMLQLNDTFASVRELIETDYFEKIIEKYMLDNKHASVVSIYPEVGLTARKDAELADKLGRYKASLSKNEIKDIVGSTRSLREYQETPDTDEAIRTIPLLQRDDIDKQSRRIHLDKKEISSIPVLHHELYTNGIAYVCLAFDVTELEEYAPYISLLSFILGAVDTVNYDYLELSNEINLNTGGMGTDVGVFPIAGDTDNYRIMYELNTRVLYSSMSNAFGLMKEIIKGSIINNTERVREILLEMRAELKSTLEASGNSTAIERALGYDSKSSFCQNRISGIAFYRFLSLICDNYYEYSDELIKILEALVYKIFRKEKLLVSITADDEGYRCFEEASYDLFESFYPDNDEKLPALLPLYRSVMGKWNEGFKAPGKVQYVARTGNYIKKGYEYTGHLKVLRTILNYDYLWTNIRVKGGAYGAMSGFTRSGNAYFVSYRDPNLAETNKVYENIPGYIEAFDAGERDITKYIIGTISDLDVPLTPRAMGKLAYDLYISGTDQFDLQKERDEILALQAEDIRKLAGLVQSILDCKSICVVGSEAAIEENKEMFGLIEKLN